MASMMSADPGTLGRVPGGADVARQRLMHAAVSGAMALGLVLVDRKASRGRVGADVGDQRTYRPSLR
jgi:hypothetical protein